MPTKYLHRHRTTAWLPSHSWYLSVTLLNDVCGPQLAIFPYSFPVLGPWLSWLSAWEHSFTAQILKMATLSTSNGDKITATQGPQNPEHSTTPRNGQDIEKPVRFSISEIPANKILAFVNICSVNIIIICSIYCPMRSLFRSMQATAYLYRKNPYRGKNLSVSF